MSPLATALMAAYQKPPTPPTNSVSPTDVTGAYATSDAANNQRYQSQLAANNGMWGGLAGIGGAGISALPKLLGALGPAAAGAGAAGVGAGASAADFAAMLPLLAL